MTRTCTWARRQGSQTVRCFRDSFAAKIVPLHSYAKSVHPHWLAQSNLSLETIRYRGTICPEVAVDKLSNGSTDIVKNIDVLQEAPEATFSAGQLIQRTDKKAARIPVPAQPT
jgi:hypothetical protein